MENLDDSNQTTYSVNDRTKENLIESKIYSLMVKKGSVKTPPPKPKANPNYPSTTGKPSGKGRGNTPR